MAPPSEIIKFRDGGDGLAERFAAAVDRSPDPEADMSKVLRQLVRWYAGEPGAKLPARPPTRQEGSADD